MKYCKIFNLILNKIRIIYSCYENDLNIIKFAYEFSIQICFLLLQIFMVNFSINISKIISIFIKIIFGIEKNSALNFHER